MNYTVENAPKLCIYPLHFIHASFLSRSKLISTLQTPKLLALRKYLSLAVGIMFLCISLTATAQQNPAPVRCGSMEHLDQLIKQDPSLPSKMAADEERLHRQTLQKIQERTSNKGARLNAIVTIPVVVHILLPNPGVVTDADVIWQINKLNEDFGGTNADKVNAGVFASRFGESQIRFCLAQQDPSGNPSNGIDRVVSGVTWDRFTSNTLKNPATCGTRSWDPNRYFNIWVATSTDGTLGIATFPNTDLPENQGICLTLAGFGNNPAYVSPSFNKGRTAVHEAGHFFYARHIWGDGAGCQPDFPAVAGLPSFADDTPAQSRPTSGCPTGTVTADCTGSLNPPGKMYQNYMDYTDDACYCMFTDNQVARMEAALTLFRPSLMSSNVCTPPAAVLNDAALQAIVSPAAGSCGNTATNSFCTPVFTPKVTIKNYGTANLTSLAIKAQIDNGAIVSYNWTGNLAPQATATFDITTLTSSMGSHALKVYVDAPNGAADGRNGNDTLTTTYTIQSPVTGPVEQGFESASFPPSGWRNINPNNGSLTWERTTVAAKSGIASARMQFYDYSGSTLHQDFLLSSSINIQEADSIILSFERAYRAYSTSAADADTLAVVISFDCGATFTEVWKRGGVNLATVAGVQTTAYAPAAGDWMNTRINLKPFVGNATNVIVGFKAVNRYGNNLYIDDVQFNVYTSTRDAAVSSIVEPSKVLCVRDVMPVVKIASLGNDTLRNVKVLFRVDSGALDSVAWTGVLGKGQEAPVTLKLISLTTPGAHLLTVYTKQPNGQADYATSNDTSRIRFTVTDQQMAPLKEGFESATFPPANWAVNSSGKAYTWEQTNRGAGEQTGAAWIRNYRFSANGKPDDLYMPPLQVGNFDSLIVRFDVSHVLSRPAGSTVTPIDTLEVLLTMDCGKTFQSVYKKWGAALQTAGAPGQPITYPANDTLGHVPTMPAQWRTEYVDISKLVPVRGQFQVVFRSMGNNGNNIWLDKVDIATVTLPALLKKNGYLVGPNPFEETIYIWHLEPPVKLQSVQVVNMLGKVVYKRTFNGNAPARMPVVIGGGSGVYFVQMKYADKTVTERLLKVQ